MDTMQWLNNFLFLIVMTFQVTITAVHLVFTKRELLFLQLFFCSSSHSTLRDTRMLWINRPSVCAYRCVVTQRLLALYVATVASPTDRLQVIQIKKQLQIAFVRFKVVHHCTARVIPARLQVCTAAAVLALVRVTCECLSP